MARLLDELRDAVHIFVAHALRGLIEQHQLGIHGQCGGDLQRTLAAVGQLAGMHLGKLGQAHLVEQLHGPVVELIEYPLRAPEMHRQAR